MDLDHFTHWSESSWELWILVLSKLVSIGLPCGFYRYTWPVLLDEGPAEVAPDCPEHRYSRTGPVVVRSQHVP